MPAEGPFRLRLGKPGSFDSLGFEHFVRRPPGPGQVEIEVRAAGLNFSDVLKAMGLYPGITDEVVPLGIECSGVVTAVGARRRSGSASATRCWAWPPTASPRTPSHGRICPGPQARPASPTTRRPRSPSPSLPPTTPWSRLAHLQPGERVLIHAGAGGVGLAAIQIAQHLGAEVFATAGSARKREFLRRLGVQARDELAHAGLRRRDHAGHRPPTAWTWCSTRSPATRSPRAWRSLRAYGRFLEIGKTDIYKNRMIGLLPFQDNLSYFAIDLDRMLRQKPELHPPAVRRSDRALPARRLSAAAADQFPIGDSRRRVPLHGAAEEHRQGGGLAGADRAEPGEYAPAGAAAGQGPRRTRTYLITGGLGALGLQVAAWLAEQGARHVALFGAGRAPATAPAAIDAAGSPRGEVVAIQGDVADDASLAEACRVDPRAISRRCAG